MDSSKQNQFIDRETIDKVLERAEIVDVVSDFVSLQRRGQNFVGLCPFHQDTRPSFYVSKAKNICKCFACGEGGSPLNFIIKKEGLTYLEAIRYLAKKYNIPIVEKQLTKEQIERKNEREALFQANSFAKDAFIRGLWEIEEGRLIGLSYFKQRGFREEIIKAFQLGYSLEKSDFLTEEVKAAGLSIEPFEKLGLITTHDNGRVWERFQGRVIFPIHTISGSVVGFGGRILKKSDKAAKYVNSIDSDIYSKSNEIYGLFQARQSISKLDKCLVVEGYMDVLALAQAGIQNVVASSGTAFTPQQARKIKRFTENVTLFFDGDAAGVKAALRSIDIILQEGMNAKVLLLPDNHDPDTFVKSRTLEEFYDFMNQNEQDCIEFKVDILSKNNQDPSSKVHVINEVLESVSVIPDDISREVYTRKAAEILQITEDLAFASVADKRKSFLEQKQREYRYQKEQLNSKSSSISVADKDEVVSHTVPNQADVGLQKTSSSLNPGEFSLLYSLLKNAFVELESLVELSEDGKEFRYLTVHEFVFEQMKEFEEPDFLSETFRKFFKMLYEEMFPYYNLDTIHSKLLSYDDDIIRELATKIITKDTELSIMHMEDVDKEDENKKLLVSITKLINTLKYNLIQDKINKLTISLTDNPIHDSKIEVMKKIQFFTKQRNELANLLGERVLIPNSDNK